MPVARTRSTDRLGGALALAARRPLVRRGWRPLEGIEVGLALGERGQEDGVHEPVDLVALCSMHFLSPGRGGAFPRGESQEAEQDWLDVMF